MVRYVDIEGIVYRHFKLSVSQYKSSSIRGYLKGLILDQWCYFCYISMTYQKELPKVIFDNLQMMYDI